MNLKYDHMTLSSYVDGELDAESIPEVEAFIEANSIARQYVLDTVKTTARLRNSLNRVLHEEVPDQLLNFARIRKKYGIRQTGIFEPLFRMAAGILLILFGFVAGWLMPTSESDFGFTTLTTFPSTYNQIVQKALEYNVSGMPHQGQSLENDEIIIVTPIKTYRNKDGQYFREFHMEVRTETQYGQIHGLAYRQNGEWKTKAVYFQ